MKIEIKPATLKRLAKSDVEITDADINQLLDGLTRIKYPEGRAVTPSKMALLKRDDDPLGAKLNQVIIDGRSVSDGRLKWNPLIHYMIKIAAEQGHNHTRIRTMFDPLNLYAGHNRNHGWKYIKEADMSAQNASTDRVIMAVKNARTKLKIALRLELTLKNGEQRYI